MTTWKALYSQPRHNFTLGQNIPENVLSPSCKSHWLLWFRAQDKCHPIHRIDTSSMHGYNTKECSYTRWQNFLNPRDVPRISPWYHTINRFLFYITTLTTICCSSFLKCWQTSDVCVYFFLKNFAFNCRIQWTERIFDDIFHVYWVVDVLQTIP